MRSALAVGDVLRRSSLLHDVHSDTLDELVRASRTRHLERGAVFILEGDDPTSVFVVADGLMRVFTTSFDGTEPTLTVLFPGDLVGELGVLDETIRSASVGALRPSAVIEISGTDFRAAFEHDISISRALVAHLSHRLRSTSTRLCDLTVLDLGARLAKYLASEMTAGSATPFVDLVFTQSELGQLVGGARQTVNQELAAMERDGLITVRGRRIDVLDPARLRRRAAHPV